MNKRRFAWGIVAGICWMFLVAGLGRAEPPASELERAETPRKIRLPQNDLLAEIDSQAAAGQAEDRTRKDKRIRRRGATEASEKAVEAALSWLAAHQMPDGGWSFKHETAAKCNGQCRNPGQAVEARNAATAMALLPFLEAGHTHTSGKYRNNVKAGLYYLVSHIQLDDDTGGSLHEDGGTLYSHGLASLALCEAYAASADKALQRPAQSTLDFIAYAQDPIGGGWRYQPKQAGDTSVTGWQVLALRSGYDAYLATSDDTFAGVSRFLDSVQSNNGANYGYTSPGIGRATTAMGLLCRMHLGWERDNAALKQGVAWLAKQGPSQGNMYYNLFATRVMYHRGGKPWKAWNPAMRDLLVNAQATEGHEAGSWYFTQGDHGASRGGRLYCTSLAAMILSVYRQNREIEPFRRGKETPQSEK